MKTVMILLAMLGTLGASPSYAGNAWVKEKFSKVLFLEAGGKGAESGLSASNAKDFEDTDLMAIDAGMVIEKVYAIIDSAVVGLSLFEVGDDDDSDGFIVHHAVTLGSAGMYGWASGPSGAYLELQGVIGADVYVAPQAKLYSASGKEVKLNVTGTASAGKARVVVEGYKVGTN